MPACNVCQAPDLARSDFSAKQLKKPAGNRTCKKCQQLQAAEPAPDRGGDERDASARRRDVVLQNAERLDKMGSRLDAVGGLVESVLGPGPERPEPQRPALPSTFQPHEQPPEPSTTRDEKDESDDGDGGGGLHHDLPPGPVADAHAHYWSPHTHRWLVEVKSDPEHPFHKFAPLCRDYFPHHHREDMRGVDLRETVYIQANMHVGGHFSPLEEVAWVSGLAAASHGRGPHAIVGYAPLDDPPAAEAVIDACMKYPNYRGVRFMLDWHPSRAELRQTDRGDYMSSLEFREGLGLLAARGLVFELQVCSCQLREAAGLAADIEGLQFVLNHAGFPLRNGHAEWLAGMKALAACPNVVCKIGGLGTYDDPPFTPAETQRHIAACVELFGPSRCLFSSNLPVDLTDMTPAERWSSFWRSVQALGLPGHTAADMFRGNALRVYNMVAEVRQPQ